nr:hypothetical protein GCM10020063_009770 [Dactylosporangium thailandense]
MISHCHIDLDDLDDIRQLMATASVDGIATIEGIADRSGLLRFAHTALTMHRHRDSDPDGITVIHDRRVLARQPGCAGFGRHELDLHTESSALPRPPALMVLYCQQAAATGGACHLVDAAVLVRELAHRDPELLQLLKTPRSALFGGAAGHLGAVLTMDGTRMSVRLRLDGLVQYSPLLARRVPDLRRVLADLVVTVQLQPGTAYLLSNTRWLHGRAAFAGERVMYRVLGDPRDGFAMPAGFPDPAPVETAVP